MINTVITDLVSVSETSITTCSASLALRWPSFIIVFVQEGCYPAPYQKVIFGQQCLTVSWSEADEYVFLPDESKHLGSLPLGIFLVNLDFRVNGGSESNQNWGAKGT